MKRTLCLTIAVLAIGCQPALASLTGKISGRVTDLQGGEGLYGARVEVVGTGMGALADRDGYFHIINISPGSYALRARMTGYAAVTMIDVRVNPGLTARADFKLKMTPIQGQEVTITAERPLVVKDLTATQRVIRTDELDVMPFDNPQQALAVQAGVVMRGEQLHVRGGRSDEVSYLIDGISIRDAVEGTSGLLVNTNALSELSMMTGVFDAEYGQVMSGVISAQVKDGSKPAMHFSANSGSLFPGKWGRGFRDYQADWGRPWWGSRLKAFIAGDLTLSDDWDAHHDIVPHQDRQDYSALAKLTGELPWGQRVSLLGILSRSQFGRYGHDWFYAPANFRSDLRRGKLLSASLNQSVLGSAFYTVTAGWFWNRNTFGVRDTFWDIGRHWWEDIRFFDYWDNQIYRNEQDSLVFSADYNRYGYDCPLFYRFGNYWKYRDRITDERFIKGEFVIQANRHHLVKTGLQHQQYRISNFFLYPSSLGLPIFDEYHRYPSFQEAYVHDKLEFEGLIVNLGLRYERLNINIADYDTATLWYRHAASKDLKAKQCLSPRLGLSYVISTVTTFHLAYGKYFQQPPLQYYYQYLNVSDPTRMKGDVLGNPGLLPPTATNLEFGTVTQLGKDWSLDFTLYYKDINHLVSINFVQDTVADFYQYQNVDNASVRGAEFTLRKQYGQHLTGELRYTYATAEGTASNPEESWQRYLQLAPYDSLSGFERKTVPLAFDQRHKLVLLVSAFNRQPLGGSRWGLLARDVSLNALLQYGSGMPYTAQAQGRPSGAGEIAATAVSPSIKQLDLKATKTFRVGPVNATLSAEVINLMGWNNYNYSYEQEMSPYEVYRKYLTLPEPAYDYGTDSPYYDAGGDRDHNGSFTVAEQKARRQQFLDAFNNNPALSGPPRLFRVGLSFVW